MKISLTIISIISFQSYVYAGVMKDNVDYRYYVDFANNTGIFKPGASNIPIYYKDADKKNNSLSGGYVNNGILKTTIAKGIPMPDFSSVFRYRGTGTLIDPQYTQTNRHTTQNRGGYNTYGSVDHYDSKNIENTIKRIHTGSLGAEGWSQYAADVNKTEAFKAFWSNQFDLDISRVNKLVTDVAPAKLMDFGRGAERYDANGNRLADSKSNVIAAKFRNGELTHFYRLGGGNQYSADGSKLSRPYRFLTGGVYTNPDDEYKGGYPSRVFAQADAQWRIAKDGLYDINDEQLGLPIATLGGDSGSPIFGYSPTDNTWYLLGTLHGSKGNSNTYAPLSASELKYYKKFFQADAIVNDNTSNVTWGNGVVKQNNNTWDYKTLNSSDIKTLVNDLSNEKLNNTEDIIFSGKSAKIIVQENLNTGAGSITFNNDYTVEGINTDISYMGAGLIVNENSEVTWKVKGVNGDNLHKLGTGTLIVNGTGDNQGGLRVGDGTVILNQLKDNNGNSKAFKEVIIASGRPTVILGADDQIRGENISFVYRGGTLDLNGHDISFDRIRHVDDGAIIRNMDSSKKSTLNIIGGINWGGKVYKQIYKGFLGGLDQVKKDKLNISFTPTNNKDLLVLTGGANVDGNLNIDNGHVVMTGSPTYFANVNNDNINADAASLGIIEKNYIKDIIDSKAYVFNTIDVANKGKFEIGYSANVYGNINTNNSELLIGKTTDNTYCVDVDGANGPVCKNNQSGSKLYSDNVLDTYYYGNVTLSNSSTYKMGLAHIEGELKDLDNTSSLIMTNNTNFILNGVSNNISSLSIDKGSIYLGNKNNYSKLMVGTFTAKDADLYYNIGYQNYKLLSSEVIINELKNANINIFVNLDKNSFPLDYSKEIPLITAQQIDNDVNVKLKNPDGLDNTDGIDIGLYKFNLKKDATTYSLARKVGIQKNITSDFADRTILAQTSSLNLTQMHLTAGKERLLRSGYGDGFWMSSGGKRLWYSSNHSYRDFRQDFTDISAGYNLSLEDKGVIGIAYSYIKSNTNKSTNLKANYIDLYGSYNIFNNTAVYAVGSYGHHKGRFESPYKKLTKKENIYSYILGIDQKFISSDLFDASIFVDMTSSNSNIKKIKSNGLDISYKNKTNYWSSIGNKSSYTFKPKGIDKIKLTSMISYNRNFSNNEKVSINQNKFNIEKNKQFVNLDVTSEFYLTKEISPYLNINYSIGDKYKPVVGATVGLSYSF